MRASTSRPLSVWGSAATAAAGCAAMSPGLAFASEGAGISAILPQMNEFIPMLVAFLLLWFILAKFGWPLFERMLKRRENTIKDSLEKSEAARAESERVLAEYKAELADAKKEAAQIVADAKKAAEGVKADIEASAQKQADEMVTKARAAIENERKQAVAELQSSVANLSVQVASRLVGEDLSDAEHRKMIERYVEEAGSLNAN